jgi:dTDP-4-dehydrorhamnose reductase
MHQFKELSNIDSLVASTYLVIGADGLIGKALVNELQTLTPNVYATSRRQGQPGSKVIFFDLAKSPGKLFSEGWIQKITTRGRMIVFICAAITKIADCEQDPESSHLVNVINTVELGKKLMLAGAEVVFISTNAVFSGLEQLPTQSSRPNPSTNYGRQKAEAEIKLMKVNRLIPNAPALIIVRLTKVITKDNPLINDWIQNLRSGRQIHAFENRTLSPISLQYTTKKIVEIAKRGCAGIYHLSGSGDLTYYNFACLLASALGANPELVNSVSATASNVSLEHSYSSLGNEVLEPFIDLVAEQPQTVIKTLVA